MGMKVGSHRPRSGASEGRDAEVCILLFLSHLLRISLIGCRCGRTIKLKQPEMPPPMAMAECDGRQDMQHHTGREWYINPRPCPVSLDCACWHCTALHSSPASILREEKASIAFATPPEHQGAPNAT